MEGWTDAAGGTTSHMGAGLGGLVPPFRYFYLPWPAWLNSREANTDGVVFASKLTCLELLGPLVLLATCADQGGWGALAVLCGQPGGSGRVQEGAQHTLSLHVNDLPRQSLRWRTPLAPQSQ